jgi:hypothetical protein
MNIINIGGWYVGNTAISDWMDGFEEIAFIKGEFNITRLENGIMDMIVEPDPLKKIEMIRIQKKACYKSPYIISRSFIGHYTKFLLKPNFSHTYDYDRNLGFYINFHSYLSKYEEKLISHEEFDEVELWRDWLNRLLSSNLAHKNSKHTVFQNPFFYNDTFDGHKDVWPKLFSPYKLIFVHRDPLDQFSDIVKNKAHTLVSWPRFHKGTETMHPADRFLIISKKIYNARLKMAENYTKDELAILSFENFLQEHSRVTKGLKNFLDIKTQRDDSNKRFILENSLKNIGKGKFNEEVASLLKGKEYVMEELNNLREQLMNHDNAI